MILPRPGPDLRVATVGAVSTLRVATARERGALRGAAAPRPKNQLSNRYDTAYTRFAATPAYLCAGRKNGLFQRRLPFTRAL